MGQTPSGPKPGRTLTLTDVDWGDAEVRRELAGCLSCAFSSGLWKNAPLPLGTGDEPHSAFGVIARLGPLPKGFLATLDDTEHRHRAVGCVIGGVLDRPTIELYGLNSFSAREGDGLLAFIGIVPTAQGTRVKQCGEQVFEVTDGQDAYPACSLARMLFESWLEFPRIKRCPSVFIRTRRRIGPILHLSHSTGFDYCGKFSVEFCGETQDRLVYRRSNGANPPYQGTKTAVGPAGRSRS